MRRAFEQRREAHLAARGACIMSYEAPRRPSATPLSATSSRRSSASSTRAGSGERAGRARGQDEGLPPPPRAVRRHRARDGSLHRAPPQLRVLVGRVELPPAVLAAPHQRRRSSPARPARTTARRTAQTCVGPRWLDPVTQNERKNLHRACGRSPRRWTTRASRRRTSSASAPTTSARRACSTATRRRSTRTRASSNTARGRHDRRGSPERLRWSPRLPLRRLLAPDPLLAARRAR